MQNSISKSTENYAKKESVQNGANLNTEGHFVT